VSADISAVNTDFDDCEQRTERAVIAVELGIRAIKRLPWVPHSLARITIVPDTFAKRVVAAMHVGRAF
jgi:hypothetical protein